jgi:hypothetical protein
VVAFSWKRVFAAMKTKLGVRAAHKIQINNENNSEIK